VPSEYMFFFLVTKVDRDWRLGMKTGRIFSDIRPSERGSNAKWIIRIWIWIFNIRDLSKSRYSKSNILYVYGMGINICYFPYPRKKQPPIFISLHIRSYLIRFHP
jgi:hypothetical protein